MQIGNLKLFVTIRRVKTVNDIALTNGTLSRGISAKVFKHKCESITLDNVTFGVDSISLPEFINPSETQSEIRIIENITEFIVLMVIAQINTTYVRFNYID